MKVVTSVNMCWEMTQFQLDVVLHQASPWNPSYLPWLWAETKDAIPWCMLFAYSITPPIKTRGHGRYMKELQKGL